MPILDQLRHGVDVTKWKANQLVRINNVQVEIGNLRRGIQNAREKISIVVVELHKQNSLSHPELEELCVGIDNIEAQIAGKEAQIVTIRAEAPPQAPPPATPAYQPPATTNTTSPVNPCPHCRFDAPIGATFCPNCGKSIPQTTNEPITVTAALDPNKCVNCGFSLPESATFCPNCGKPVAPTNQTSA